MNKIDPATGKPKRGRPRKSREKWKTSPDKVPTAYAMRQEAMIRALPPRYQLFMRGELDVTEMDMQELERCQLRELDGEFHGLRPATLPAKFMRAVQDEYLRRLKQDNMGMVGEAYETLQRVLKSPGAPAVAKVQAAKEILDRLEGAPDQNSHISVEIEKPAWQDLVESSQLVIEFDKPKQIDNIVDAEIIED